MGNTILYRMSAGIAGAISRSQDLTVEPQILDATKPFAAYGLGGKIVGGKFVPIEAADAVTVMVGIFVRPYPTASQPDKIRQVGSGYNFAGDNLKRGYVTVNIGSDASSVALTAPVYMRVATPTNASPLGAFLAAADGENTVQITNAYFNGPGDADGNIELAYNI
ncbi:structural cement protein Gp24 [Cedecea sp. MMO-103]|uniref:structural cement protein Gp24 n=1 Tax=Cedecea sp. MMO-103 TaxID=3081238 RepID=UPI00301A15A9